MVITLDLVLIMTQSVLEFNIYLFLELLLLGRIPRRPLYLFLVKTGQNRYGVDLKKRVLTKVSTFVGRKPSTINQTFSLSITS